MNLIFDILIEANGPALHLKGDHTEVDMIPFKGSVSSSLFEGIVEPCGVDTQTVNAAGVRHMSARYMLTGKDKSGKDAHIFIENNGYFDDATKHMPFRTVPTFYTDSPVLAPYLHRNQFVGEGSIINGQLHIRFYDTLTSNSEGGLA